MVMNDVSLRESFGNLSVMLMTVCVLYRYFLVIQPFKNRTSGLFLLYLIDNSLKSLVLTDAVTL